jgi:hypothetical protein
LNVAPSTSLGGAVTKMRFIGHKGRWFESLLESNFLHKVKIEKFVASLNQGSFFTLRRCAIDFSHDFTPKNELFRNKFFIGIPRIKKSIFSTFLFWLQIG